MTIMNPRRSLVAIGAALLIATFLLCSVSIAQTSADRLKATIPFEFYVGETLMPAGDYEVQPYLQSVTKLYSADAGASVMFSTLRLSNPGGQAGRARLIFNIYGNDHFLSEMWWGGTQDGYKPIPSKRERELARNNTPVRVSVAR